MPRTSKSLPRLIIRSSSIHAAGCYTLDAVPRGGRIVEYDGERLSKDVADDRYAGRPVTYLFGYGEEGNVIDGFGSAMFINHSCAPNCETTERNERIYINAIRDIAAGEELLYEYHLYDSEEEHQNCYCGAPNCRGTMFSEAELARRAAKAEREKRATSHSSRR